jgi:hypothetical protein
MLRNILADVSPHLDASISPMLASFFRAAGVSDVDEKVAQVINDMRNTFSVSVAQIVPPSVISPTAPAIKTIAVLDGIYTIAYPGGKHRTLRVKTPLKGNLANRTILEFLSGSDNTSDYTGFAFLDGQTIRLWRRFAESGDLLEAAKVLVKDPETAGLLYAEESGRCYRCNRLLTVPASLHRGLGPVCAGVFGATE